MNSALDPRRLQRPRALDTLDADLLDNKSFRKALYARMVDLAEHNFNPERIDAYVDDYVGRMRRAMANEYRRFNYARTEEDFVKDCEKIKAFFRLRYDYIMEVDGGKKK